MGSDLPSYVSESSWSGRKPCGRHEAEAGIACLWVAALWDYIAWSFIADRLTANASDDAYLDTP